MPATTGKAGPPADLRKFLEKRLAGFEKISIFSSLFVRTVYINGNRHVVGVLRGYDNFMNIVLDNTLDIRGQEKQEIGMVVIRGNSIVYWECLDRVK
ncbi:putative small nuclear ribonucleoprotein G [Cardiosporidium cionae]|uniref:Small nuclear ribonucleoprotein G n=1 Tax=Cardiosporidium cionae TaxID=476202 RepID=A0ABQ7JB42_9APIC|nr:putative small nuclear ribonucleoprotein G [Cardiosporidium cionae]|eukprot:KAF8821179.1 putative small nuclear ribonucleoprotein G [Cardiosporidium cionae]